MEPYPWDHASKPQTAAGEIGVAPAVRQRGATAGAGGEGNVMTKSAKDDRRTRRNFLKKALLGAALGPQSLRLAHAGTSADAPENTGVPQVFLEPFNYEGVRLLDGRLKSQYSAARDYFFAIAADDMLKGFRARAGQPAPGNDLIGWYGGDPRTKTWWSAGDTFNTFGQWLSAMARMSKATGDQEIGAKAARLMNEWAKAIESDGYFYYSRKPIEPHYTYEKTVCGLVDLAEYGGRKDALPLLEKITDWAVGNLDRQRKPDSGTEWYTLSENLYRAYQLTGNPKYKTFGDVWRFTPYWKSFVGGTDLPRYNHHAYSHMNTLSSAAMTYAVSGDPEYLQIIKNAYDWHEQTQFYATGGYGPDERLQPPDGSLGRSLETTIRTFETPCGSWAGFKLARYLMKFTGEAKYGDWTEKLIYNGIGAALPMGPHGQTFYYSDYRLGGCRKIYYPDANYPCCSGTYPQAVADYHNIIYFKDPTSLYVNLFVPSVVTWNHDGQEIGIEQETAFPEADTTNLTIRTTAKAAFSLKFRVPRWTHGATVKINGEAQDVLCRPGAWAVIERKWSPGDRVTVRLPMHLALVPIDKQHPHRVAVTYGPVVLVRDQDPILEPKGEDVSDWIAVRGQPLEFSAVGQPNGTLLPFHQLGLGTPYNMYFDLQV